MENRRVKEENEESVKVSEWQSVCVIVSEWVCERVRENTVRERRELLDEQNIWADCCLLLPVFRQLSLFSLSHVTFSRLFLTYISLFLTFSLFHVSCSRIFLSFSLSLFLTYLSFSLSLFLTYLSLSFSLSLFLTSLFLPTSSASFHSFPLYSPFLFLTLSFAPMCWFPKNILYIQFVVCL